MGLSGPLQSLADVVLEDPGLRDLLARADAGDLPTAELTGPPALRPFAVAGLARSGKPVLVVTPTSREAEDLAAELVGFLPADSIAYYPSWETLPHERLSPRSDTVGRRLGVLRRLVHPDDAAGTGPVQVVVAPVRSVLQPQVKGLGDLVPVVLEPGSSAELDSVVQALSAAAYTRVDLVEKRGEFAVRGGILDVFPPTEEHPLRVEFWGDDVEEIRSFSVADQRTLEPVDRLWAPPCRELLLTDDVRRRAAELGQQHPQLLELTDQLAAGIAVEGMESLAPALVDDMELLLDLMPADSRVLVVDPERVRGRAHDLVATSEEFLGASWAAAASGGQAPIDLGAASYRALADVRTHGLERGLSWWGLSPFGLDEPLSDQTAVSDGLKPVEPYRGDVEAAVKDVTAWLAEGYRVAVVQPGHGPAQRTVEVLGEHDVAARLQTPIQAWDEGIVLVTEGPLEHGLVDATTRIVILTGDDLSGQKASTRDMRKMPARRKRQIDPLELSAGDYVVHEQHGVGRFVEMKQRVVQGATREYLVLEYGSSKRGAPPDRLYVPADALDQVTRYVGGEQPSLDRLGGGDWTKRKNRARRAVREIAAELIKLYAARQATQGYAFGPDTPWQRELEDAFAFTETPDQLSTVDEVKADMRRTVPMDRLVCGDVGYGKTEIAVRAAFKAVQDGKQVAIVVPTTVLAQQHYETFGERLATFPVNVEMLSRFRSPAEQRAVAEGIGTGEVDIVVGTHRVLQKDVQFRDLGLVVIDEEHRFGVKHKERLKQMRTEVDVLSMTATPIPRTLHMALSGVRDISVIETPPENRQPIETHVVERSDDVLREAIVREIDRGGQVYYVHNRVQGIEQEAHRLRELVPTARYVVAHGQMDDRKLERVMVEFADAEHDVLVCTTIIESGLDIPNVNTIVINRAGTLGLAQLYQLRGRVGRSAEKAYAYLLYTKEQHLTEQARKRLQAVFEASELGAGFKIAMHDLEIRGAGNILGAEQHGHVAAVGFELYTQLLEEAVNEQRGAPRAAALPEITVDLALSTAIPDDYVPSRQRKLELYRRIAELAVLDDLAGLREELRDRYGPPPEPVRNLLYGVEVKLRAVKAGATEVRARGPELRVVLGRDIQPDERTRVLRSFPKAQAGQRQVRVSVLDVKADWRDALTGLLDRLAS